jgi:hypothetical protein
MPASARNRHHRTSASYLSSSKSAAPLMKKRTFGKPSATDAASCRRMCSPFHGEIQGAEPVVVPTATAIDLSGFSRRSKRSRREVLGNDVSTSPYSTPSVAERRRLQITSQPCTRTGQVALSRLWFIKRLTGAPSNKAQQTGARFLGQPDHAVFQLSQAAAWRMPSDLSISAISCRISRVGITPASDSLFALTKTMTFMFVSSFLIRTGCKPTRSD